MSNQHTLTFIIDGEKHESVSLTSDGVESLLKVSTGDLIDTGGGLFRYLRLVHKGFVIREGLYQLVSATFEGVREP